MKTYILQKDLPNLKAGSELTLSCDRERYEIDNDDTKNYFSMYKKVVEDNPEWFKLKEDVIKNRIVDVWIAGERYVPTNYVFKYSEEDMRKCFYAPIHIDDNGRADTFEDYLKIINEIK